MIKVGLHSGKVTNVFAGFMIVTKVSSS